MVYFPLLIYVECGFPDSWPHEANGCLFTGLHSLGEFGHLRVGGHVSKAGER